MTLQTRRLYLNSINKGIPPPKATRRAAIIPTIVPGNNRKYADLIKEARVIELKEIGISDMRCRRSVTGGLVMEIAGKESASKADILANKLRDVFHGSEEVRINRPVKKAELRILGLDDSVSKCYTGGFGGWWLREN